MEYTQAQIVSLLLQFSWQQPTASYVMNYELHGTGLLKISPIQYVACRPHT